MQYGVSDRLLDLQTAASKCLTKVPDSFVIEVNPRLPGLVVTRGVHSTYCISYDVFHSLIAVGDAEKIAALSQRFRAGPQYWRDAVFITRDNGGVFASDDVGDKLKKRCPDLWRSVSSYNCYFEKGPNPTADEAIWFAWFVVCSRVGRRHLLEISERVRAEVRFVLL